MCTGMTRDMRVVGCGHSTHRLERGVGRVGVGAARGRGEMGGHQLKHRDDDHLDLTQAAGRKEGKERRRRESARVTIQATHQTSDIHFKDAFRKQQESDRRARARVNESARVNERERERR